MPAQLVAGEDFPGVKVFRITGETILGRLTDATLQIPDPKVSRRHARIYQDGEDFVLEDLGSSNGTILNGLKIKREQLSEGDRLTVGSYDFTFQRLQAKPRIRTKIVDADSGSIESTEGGSTLQMVDATQEFALDALAGEGDDQINQTRKRLELLRNVSEAIAHILDTDMLLDSIMDQLFETFSSADRGFIMLVEENSTDLTPAVARNRQSNAGDEEITVSQNIIKEVMENQQAVLSSDAMGDERFDHLQSIAEFSIRSMMCAPLLCAGRVLGIIHIDTTNPGNLFERDDLLLLIGIATQAAQAIRNAELVKEKEQEVTQRARLERYFSPTVVEAMMRGEVSMELGGSTVTGTVLFADIVGFTAMSETMEPVKVVDLLNRYFRFVNEIIFKYSGSINKFGGDAVLALWGVIPKDPGHAIHTVEAAMEMQNTLFRFNADLEHPIGTGIGINTGSFLAGNIGSESHREFTVIGDNVNLSQRVESCSTRGQVLITEATRRLISRPLALVSFDPIQVKGKQEPVTIHSVRGLRSIEYESLVFTTIPAQLQIADTEPVSAIMISATVGHKGIAFEMETAVPIDSGIKLKIQPTLPELEIETFEATCTTQSEEAPGVYYTYIFSHEIPDLFLKLLQCESVQGINLDEQVRS